MIKEYLVQVYDEYGYPCKEPRYFKGTERAVQAYIENRFGFVDMVLGRKTLYFETTNEEDIPKYIKLEENEEPVLPIKEGIND